MTAEQLHIVAAAIRDVDGKVWSVPRPGRHFQVIQLMRDSGYEGPVSGDGQQGWLLSDGRFCTRKAGYHVARRAGQLRDGKMAGSVLTSEDLW